MAKLHMVMMVMTMTITSPLFFSVMSKDLNKGGRGFNLVTLNPKSLRPVSVMHADTYSTGLLLLT